MGQIEIKENVFWVGAIDWNIRDFHGYSTEKGTTYNAYLIKDEKVALFDTVKKEFKEDLMYEISRLVDPQKIDYLIVNHVEMDHSGAFPEIVDIIKPEKIFCSRNGHRALVEHFHREDLPYEIVKTGDTISLGKKTVTFIETPMLHWPDSMFSYVGDDKLLISSDAFGQHIASTEKYADEVNEFEIKRDAQKYFANILTVFSPHIQKLLGKVAELGIEIDMIAPDHGLIWRGDDVAKIIAMYDKWSRHQAEDKALVIYDSMWQSTEKMAKAIGNELARGGLEVKMKNLKVNHRSDILTDVLDAKAMVLGSSTLNNNMLPKMADFLTYFKGLRPKKKVVAAFGSYGWSGEAVKHINEAIEGIKLPLAHPGVKVRNVPREEDFEACRELARAVVAAAKELE